MSNLHHVNSAPRITTGIFRDRGRQFATLPCHLANVDEEPNPFHTAFGLTTTPAWPTCNENKLQVSPGGDDLAEEGQSHGK